MLIDTHCHINSIVKKEFDVALTHDEISAAQITINEAQHDGITRIINVGTNLIESLNCIKLAERYEEISCTIGIHPNDCSLTWRNDLKEITQLLKKKEQYKIVGIGECGIDRHYPEYNIQRQRDAFKAQIDLALEHNLALVVHTRDAADETLFVLDEFKGQIQRGVIHCFSEDESFAESAIALGFVLGIGGPLTYPKNTILRTIFAMIDLHKIVLETDAPFLPPQTMRGKKNHPRNIATIAHFLAQLRREPFETIAKQTTQNAYKLFQLKPLS